jgi:hypothetical protein
MVNPAELVQALLREPPEHLSFEKTRDLVKLLCWVILERRPREKRDYDALQVRTRSAEDASLFALYWLLERERRRKKKTVRGSEMRTLFNDSGGFLRVWHAQDSRELFKQARDAHVDLLFVYKLVRHICRFQQHDPTNVKYFQLGAAKDFCSECSRETAKPYSVSEIDKIWSTYKESAPYVFAFYPYLRKCLVPSNPSSPGKFMRFVEALARKQQRLARALGKAAYAADVLSTKGRDVRRSDFLNVARVCPNLPRFSESEKQIIEKYDPNKLNKKDLQHYRPIRKTP